jgi:hypothetical protein
MQEKASEPGTIPLPAFSQKKRCGIAGKLFRLQKASVIVEQN